MRDRYDVVVVGGGPAGMGAALGALEAGAEDVLIVERHEEPGGILQQCIHSGFGLHYFKEDLTGPEYAERFLRRVLEHDVDVALSSYTTGMALDSDGARRVRVLNDRTGLDAVACRSVVLAMGCRERTRGALRIPGSRPAGVYTAGLAQKMVNLKGYLPGKNVVILGSGDIGLIMARRLALEGCDVHGVFEIMPHTNGLSRNVVQCLDDFGIPLHLSTTVVRIHGRDRVEAVTVAPVDENLEPRLDRAWDVPCDTLLLSVGLIPENELSQAIGIELDMVTSGPIVSSTLETSQPGVFACGNVLHVHDLVDSVTEEALRAGRFAGERVRNIRRPRDGIQLVPGNNVSYCVPHTLSPGRSQTIYLRCEERMQPATIQIGDLKEKKQLFVLPSQMIKLELRPALLDRFHGQRLRIDIHPRSA